MTEPTWKIVDRGRVPDPSPTILYTCPGCGREALLPVLGLAIAQIGSGVVFDNDDYAMPRVIQCRKCRRQFEAA